MGHINFRSVLILLIHWEMGLESYMSGEQAWKAVLWGMGLEIYTLGNGLVKLYILGTYLESYMSREWA
jgi:hypothetical protein